MPGCSNCGVVDGECSPHSLVRGILFVGWGGIYSVTSAKDLIPPSPSEFNHFFRDRAHFVTTLNLKSSPLGQPSPSQIHCQRPPPQYRWSPTFLLRLFPRTSSNVFPLSPPSNNLAPPYYTCFLPSFHAHNASTNQHNIKTGKQESLTTVNTIRQLDKASSLCLLDDSASREQHLPERCNKHAVDKGLSCLSAGDSVGDELQPCILKYPSVYFKCVLAAKLYGE